jgi:hypothetical protein
VKLCQKMLNRRNNVRTTYTNKQATSIQAYQKQRKVKAVYPWKISKISSWVNENKYQLVIIKHKKWGKRRGKRNGQLARRVANEPRNKFIYPTRKYWGERQRYKYLTIHYPLGVSDSQETQEREVRSLGCHPCDHIFSDKWDPPGSPSQATLTA